jgi:hypothetical protein
MACAGPGAVETGIHKTIAIVVQAVTGNLAFARADHWLEIVTVTGAEGADLRMASDNVLGITIPVLILVAIIVNHTVAVVIKSIANFQCSRVLGGIIVVAIS